MVGTGKKESRSYKMKGVDHIEKDNDRNNNKNIINCMRKSNLGTEEDNNKKGSENECESRGR